MPNAAGIALIAPGKRALFLKRGPVGDHPGTWCFPGGMAISGESPEQTASRELREETGHDIGDRPLIECGSVPIVDADGRYALFATQADEQFTPELDDEQVGFAWAPLDDPPQPVHPGLAPSLPLLASDAEGGFKEEDHPRREDGKFGSGGGGKGGEEKAEPEKEASSEPAEGAGSGSAKGGSEAGGSSESETAGSQEEPEQSEEEAAREWANEMWTDSPGDVKDQLDSFDVGPLVREPIENVQYEIENLADEVESAAEQVAEITEEDRAGLEEGESFQADDDLATATETIAEKAGETRKVLAQMANDIGRLIGAEPAPVPEEGFNVIEDFTPEEARALATAVTAAKEAVDTGVDDYELAQSNLDKAMEDDDSDFDDALERAAEVRNSLNALIKTIADGLSSIEKVMAPAVARQDKRDEEWAIEWEKQKRFREGKDAAPAAADQALAFDRSPDGYGKRSKGAPLPRGGLAFDRGSVRTYDEDGRLRVAVTNISKANVCPYRGGEIPGWEDLGLEENQVYQLFRAPDELEKAATTFNNLPLLSEHVAVTADDHQPDLVIGATGSDAEFSAPYLKNSLIIWARKAIKDVEGAGKKELSCAYRYRPDMTPGTFNGVRYDGVMRDIVGNHVALVKEGRAGTDVVVGDGKPNLKESGMAATARTTTVKALLAHGAILGYLLPKIAKDQKLDAKPIAQALGGVSAKNFKAARPKIVEAIKAATKGKLAKDASIDGVAQLLDMIEAHKSGAGVDADPMPVKEEDTAEMMGEVDDALPNFLKGKLSEDDYNEAMKLRDGNKAAKDNDPKLKELGAAGDAEEDDEEDKDKEAKDGDEPPPFEGRPKRDNDGAKDGAMITKAAMDSAIKSAVTAARKTESGIREAERAVRPWVGDMAIAFDSAENVYKGALDALGVKTEGVHPSAFKTILEMQPKPGHGKPAPHRVAMDAASSDSFSKMFPEAARL